MRSLQPFIKAFLPTRSRRAEAQASNKKTWDSGIGGRGEIDDGDGEVREGD